MITYYPWSEEILNKCLVKYDQNELVTLDLELTAKCTFASCIYCDSKPKVGKKNSNELDYFVLNKLIKDAKKFGLKWIYICGLGEPLEDTRFKKLVEFASNLGIRFSVFTNGILIDEKKAKWLYNNKVCLIVKLDTFNEITFNKILGRKKARDIYKAIKLLLDEGYGKLYKNKFTDLAISIVPTCLNSKDLYHVIKFAKKNNIYPSIGELENAGRVLKEKSYRNLALENKELSIIKKKVERILWKGYNRPICPAIITGLHIDNVGNCVVDMETGLNCKWFLLKESKLKIIGNIETDDLMTIFKRVKKYRKSCFIINRNKILNYASNKFIFGGCGGNPEKIIQIAHQHL